MGLVFGVSVGVGEQRGECKKVPHLASCRNLSNFGEGCGPQFSFIFPEDDVVSEIIRFIFLYTF